MNIPLVGDEIEFAVMDEVHLDRTGFLDGILDGKYIYRYKKALSHPATQEMSLKISRKKKQPDDDSTQSEDVEQPPPSTVYGSSRYYFEPLTTPLPDGPLRDAHNQIRALQRVTDPGRQPRLTPIHENQSERDSFLDQYRGLAPRPEAVRVPNNARTRGQSRDTVPSAENSPRGPVLAPTPAAIQRGFIQSAASPR
ncbi:hypothetical protein DY000_02013821 [Brassica cretica]|uniref:Uncharacterized protein n=1 Tax=Brassica cretica TaxID=69181 RepID=A0ABQ7DD26_BRACR|nr:hypothetical protein DY000_02013821 [Brassica cretica]